MLADIDRICSRDLGRFPADIENNERSNWAAALLTRVVNVDRSRRSSKSPDDSRFRRPGTTIRVVLRSRWIPTEPVGP